MSNLLARYFTNNDAPIIGVRFWPYGESFARRSHNSFQFLIWKFLIEIRKPYPKDWIKTSFAWISPMQNAATMSQDWHGEKDND
jgi:hypothetical protein